MPANRVEWVRGEQQLLPRIAARIGVDVVHSLANTAPGWGRFRRVTTIHDLSYRLVPSAHLGLLGLGMRVLVPLAAHRSHRILVDAASTGVDLRRILQVPADKIDVVPLGCRCSAARASTARGGTARSPGTRGAAARPLRCREAPAQEPHASDRRACADWCRAPAAARASGVSDRPRAGAPAARRRPRGTRRRPVPRLGRRCDARGAVRRRSLLCLPIPTRRLRPAGARGDEPRRAGGVLGPRLARRSRGGRGDPL